MWFLAYSFLNGGISLVALFFWCATCISLSSLSSWLGKSSWVGQMEMNQRWTHMLEPSSEVLRNIKSYNMPLGVRPWIDVIWGKSALILLSAACDLWVSSVSPRVCSPCKMDITLGGEAHPGCCNVTHEQHPAGEKQDYLILHLGCLGFARGSSWSSSTIILVVWTYKSWALNGCCFPPHPCLPLSPWLAGDSSVFHHHRLLCRAHGQVVLPAPEDRCKMRWELPFRSS